MSTTKREIDWKAVERGEQKVRSRGTGRIVKDVRVFDNGDVAVRFTNGSRGAYAGWDLYLFELVPPEPNAGWDLYLFELVPPEPKRLTVWLNLYADEACGPYKSREDADDMANGKRLECREITWTVPQ